MVKLQQVKTPLLAHPNEILREMLSILEYNAVCMMWVRVLYIPFIFFGLKLIYTSLVGQLQPGTWSIG